MSYEVGKLGFPIHVKSENENSMTIYELIRFNLFLVSGNIYFPVCLMLKPCPVVIATTDFRLTPKNKL